MKDLYCEKIGILKEVLELTQGVEFTGSDDDADKYIDLIAKREELFGRAKEIDKELDKKLTGEEKLTDPKEYMVEVAVLAKQIIEQDNYMRSAVLKIHDEAKADVREINTGKNLNSLYGSAPQDSDVTSRDWSQ